MASVSNPSCIVEVGKEYPYGPSNNFPYPSHNSANINIVTVKLSGRDVYNAWKKQMLCLLTSQDMLGFIDGQFLRPSDRNGKATDEDMKAWIRSDSLVTGWILGSLSEKTTIKVVNRLTSEHKNADFSAKDAWDVLKCMYGPYELGAKGYSTPEDAIPADEAKIHELKRDHKSLYGIILRGITEMVDDKFTEGLKPTDRITNDGNTSLHVAVSTKNQEILKKLLKRIPEEDSELLNVQNSYGSTPLHVAAIVGNIDAVDVLVQRNSRLLFAMDKKGHTPLAKSIYNKHIEISWRLLKHIQFFSRGSHHTMFSGTSGDELLVLAISHKEFSLSLKLVGLCKIHNSEAVLMAIAQNFPSELSFWERMDQEIDYLALEVKHRRLIRSCGPSGAVIWKFIIFGISKIHMVFGTIIKMIVWPFIKERLQTRKDAILLLSSVVLNLKASISLSKYYTNLVFGATRLNASEVVALIVSMHPEVISSINEDGLRFIQYAVINRSEKIYSLLYKHDMSDHKYIYKTITDPDGNNLLHLAGRLAPDHKLNLISGAALKIQRELQWFKEVKEFVGPITSVQTNYADETPEMVFDREHKDLVIQGEKWMRATAESYTITAALIITIVFAAAITVPGGNNQDTGIPIHNNNIAFTVFGASVAISLFTAITSFLMFLSIFTTRFYVEDFLYKLPTKLIIGLVALFISTTAMIIAFGASLFLVFGHDNSWILIPIGALTCLPITSFVTLQFPLVADLAGATYGRSIFDKRKEYFY